MQFDDWAEAKYDAGHSLTANIQRMCEKPLQDLVPLQVRDTSGTCILCIGTSEENGWSPREALKA